MKARRVRAANWAPNWPEGVMPLPVRVETGEEGSAMLYLLQRRAYPPSLLLGERLADVVVGFKLVKIE